MKANKLLSSALLKEVIMLFIPSLLVAFSVIGAVALVPAAISRRG